MQPKYELIPFTERPRRYRIRALRDIPFHGVKAGDMGGIIASESNLSQEGECWIHDGAQVFNAAKITGNAGIRAGAKVFGHAHVCGNAVVGEASLMNHARVSGRAFVGGGSQVRDDVHVAGLSVVANAMLCGHGQIINSKIGDTDVPQITVKPAGASLTGARILSEDDYMTDYIPLPEGVKLVGNQPGALVAYKAQTGWFVSLGLSRAPIQLWPLLLEALRNPAMGHLIQDELEAKIERMKAQIEARKKGEA